MKYKMFLLPLIMSMTALVACDSDDDEEEQTLPVATISVSQESIVADADGGEYKIEVSTTYGEWDASRSGEAFFTIKAQNTTSSQGTVVVTIPKNVNTKEFSGSFTIISGSSRKVISVSQSAAEKALYECPLEGYSLVWQDEFDGDDISADWTYEVQGAGWVNNELQNYIKGDKDGRYTVETKNGILNINCFKASDGKIYSGRIKAKESKGWQYGYMEAKIKLPKGKGTWPAFWMMPCNVDWVNEGWPKCGEIDIMEEVGCVPNEVSSSLHAEGHVHTNNTQVTHAMTIENAEGEYHIYAIEWTKDYIRTYVDGKVQLYYESDGSVLNYPYNKPYYIILNLAWGGSWGGMWGVDESALPVQMQVDYVRVFQK